ncbi:MAG: preprotein translocase subunit SecE [candidate division KSB1 bacterium]|jgi:preprotein translocase subunit SecE|nr:preprotein translocase subunit SecE [candidate division KSB1 bacterium]
MFKKLSNFLQEVKQEMSKVSWPSRDELRGTTILVIVITLILSVFIFGVDKLLQLVLDLIF